MLNLLEARTNLGSVLSLPLADLSDGYSVQGITGLDPVSASLVSSSFARLDGEQYQNSRREKRNIVLEIGLESDYTTKTVGELRNNLYRYFMPKREVTLQFFTDEYPAVEILGRVESFDSPLFAKDPVATISVVCHKPDFVQPNEEVLSLATVSNGAMTTIDYLGTVETGVIFTIAINRTVTDLTVYHQPAGEQVRVMQITGSFLAGDTLEVSTLAGNKYATLKRGSSVTAVAYVISPYADWTRLEAGVNSLRIQTAGGAIPYTVRYSNRFGGL